MAFSFKGQECRERFDGAVTPENIERARRVLSLIHEEIKLGKFEYKRHFPKSKRATQLGTTEDNPRISDLMNEWLIESEKSLSPSTLHAYKKIVKGHIRPKFGATRVKNLTAKEIRQWILQDLATCKNKTVRNITSVFRTVLDRAVNDDHIHQNPFDLVKLRQLLPRSQPGSASIFVDPFTDPEKRAIVAAALEESIRNLVIFMFDSGARISEAFGLKPEDIDLEKGVVKICRAVVVGVEKSTKTHAGTRTLKLFPAAHRALEDQLKLGLSADGYVFWRPDTRQGWKYDSHLRKNFWKPLLARAGVRYRYPYQCRHTFATGLLEAGTPIVFVSKYLGHTTIEMTMRHYIRWTSEISLPTNQVPDWSREQ